MSEADKTTKKMYRRLFGIFVFFQLAIERTEQVLEEERINAVLVLCFPTFMCRLARKSTLLV